MDPVEQAIRDAHARGVAEGKDHDDTRLALKLADAQLNSAGLLASALMRVIANTPSIYLPDAATTQARDLYDALTAAGKRVERELRDLQTR